MLAMLKFFYVKKKISTHSVAMDNNLVSSQNTKSVTKSL
jgi:hypothetical protein